MPIIYCASCEGKVSEKLDQCPHCGNPLSAKSNSQITTNQDKTEKEIISIQPAMFRNRPIAFIIFLVLIPFVGLGALILIIWFLKCKATKLVVTNQRTTLTKGILAKQTNEVRHCDVRNLKVEQSFGQRIFKVGTLALSTAGQSDVEVSGTFFGSSSISQVDSR